MHILYHATKSTHKSWIFLLALFVASCQTVPQQRNVSAPPQDDIDDSLEMAAFLAQHQSMHSGVGCIPESAFPLDQRDRVLMMKAQADLSQRIHSQIDVNSQLSMKEPGEGGMTDQFEQSIRQRSQAILGSPQIIGERRFRVPPSTLICRAVEFAPL